MNNFASPAKKTVHYKGRAIKFFDRAILVPVDHPDTENVTNGCPVTTSQVLYWGEDEVIETTFSTYIPLSKSKPLSTFNTKSSVKVQKDAVTSE